MLNEPTKAPCLTCKHFSGVVQPDGTEQSERYACKAFDRIPFVILSGESQHRKPFRGDGGVQYEAEVA